MTSVRRWVRGRGLLFFMAGFLGLFYLAMAIGHANVKSVSGPVGLSERSGAASRQAIRDKEEAVSRRLSGDPALASALAAGMLIVLLGGLAVDARFLVSGGRSVPDPAPRRAAEGGSPAWRLQDVVEVYLFVLFSEAAILTLEMPLLAWLGKRKIEYDAFLILNSLLRDLCVAGFVVYVLRKRMNASLEAIGLVFRDLWRQARAGLVAYLGAIPPLLVIVLVVGALAKLFSYEPAPQEVVQIYLRETSQHRIFLFTLFVAVIGPFIEEIFFRGFSYRALRSRYGAGAAACATSAVFAFFHMNLVAFVPIFFLGLFLAWLYERTGSLVAPMFAHMAHNLLMVSLTLFFRALSGAA